jgi:DNA polymerase-1
VCKDLDTDELSIFRKVTEDDDAKKALLVYLGQSTLIVGHNWLEYDYPVINRLLRYTIRDVVDKSIDTLLLSRLVDYSRPTGHSIESYGKEFGLPKIKFNDFTQWSQEMEDYCVRDVEICSRIYSRYAGIVSDEQWHKPISVEQCFQPALNRMHDNGFYFHTDRGNVLLVQVVQELRRLDEEILKAFPPKLKLTRVVTPRLTKHGTLDRKDFRWIKDGNLSDYNGGPFSKCSWVKFNPSSHKQLVEVLREAKWAPVDKTETHKDLDREINHQKYLRKDKRTLDLSSISDKLEKMRKFGWKINENNLVTLPDSSPAPARTLARRILLESRRRTLTEWLGLVQDDHRIHGKVIGIGAWTQRMAHQNPNTANIPNEYKQDGTKKLLGKELRSLWCAPRGRLLAGVDAEGIQFRIFAHYVNSPELTRALVDGRKENHTDPHSLNKSILGPVCRTRDAAKRFIYALLLGGGIGKLGEILGCEREEAEEALSRILKRYPGLDYIRSELIPSDAQRGYFIGLDGRKVPIPGDTMGERRHKCMSGYLQNGEAIVMKMATLKWEHKLHEYDSFLVNLVHDEWQVECPDDMRTCLAVAKLLADSLVSVGEELGLKCPLAGSYINEGRYTIADNWSLTH